MKIHKTLLALGLTTILFVITLTLSPVQKEVISSEKEDEHQYVSHLSEADKSFYESLEQAGIKKTPKEFAADVIRQERMQKFLTANPELVEKTLETMIGFYQADDTEEDLLNDLRTTAAALGNSATPVLLKIMGQNAEPGSEEEELLLEKKTIVLEIIVSQAYSLNDFEYEHVLLKLKELADSPQTTEEFRVGINYSIYRIICSTEPKTRALKQATWQLEKIIPLMTLGGLGGLMDWKPTVYEASDTDFNTQD